MAEVAFINLVALPIGLGLLGFVEPCSVGSSLLFIKFLEGKSPLERIRQLGLFTATRGVFVGALGAAAGSIGTGFLTLQSGAWLSLGVAYVAIGCLFLLGRAGVLMRAIGPGLDRISGAGGAVGLGVAFGLNVPACAAPLLFALLGAAAAGSGGSRVAEGFLSLGLFGLALSLPLVVAVLHPAGRRFLDWIAALSRRIPAWVGVLFIVLGAWSVYFGLFVSLEDWR